MMDVNLTTTSKTYECYVINLQNHLKSTAIM